MKKQLLALLFLTFGAASLSFSQELLYQIRQQPASEQQIKDFLLDNKCSANYTFAVILPIGGCPRCEGAIPLFFNNAKSSFPDENRLLIAVSAKTKAAQTSLSKKEYGADTTILLKTSDPFLDNFSFETENIGVPYLAIFNNKTGELIQATATLGLHYDETFFLSFTKDLVKARTTYDIIGSDTIISTVLKYAYTPELDKLAIVDQNTSSITLCEMDEKTYIIRETIMPSPFEYKMFQAPDVPDDLALALKLMNVLNVLYLDVVFANNDKIIATASLPELYWENIETEDLAYKNKACLLHYDIASKAKAIIPLQISDTTYADHTEFFYDEKHQSLFFPFLKGWPVVGTTMEPEQTKDDPEEEPFYQNCPMVAEFHEENGRFLRYHGTLPPAHQKIKTGYLFASPKVHFTETEMILADCYSGMLFFFDTETKKLNREIPLFEGLSNYINVNEIKQSPKEEKISRLQQIIAKKSHFPFRIVDICFDGQNLYGIIANEDKTYLCSWLIIDSTNTGPKLTSFEKLEIKKETIQHTRLIRKEGTLYSICIDDSEETLQVILEKLLFPRNISM